MTAIQFPPTPPELAGRIIGDTADNVVFPVEAVASRVADALRDDGERESTLTHGRSHLSATPTWLRRKWSSTCARIFARRGRESWIASALAHQVASRAAWEALDRLGELTAFPDEALSASCGAPLGVPTGET